MIAQKREMRQHFPVNRNPVEEPRLPVFYINLKVMKKMNLCSGACTLLLNF